MPNQIGAAGSGSGIANTVIEAYWFAVALTTSTTVLTGGANSDTAVNCTVASSTGFAISQIVTLDINTPSAELGFVTAVPDGTHVTIVPTNATGWRYSHASGWSLQFVVLAPGSVIRDAVTYGNALKIDAQGRAQTYSAPVPVGLGADFLVSPSGQPSTNGIALTTSQAQPSNSVGCQFVVAPGQTIVFTIATAAPTAAPAQARTYANPSSAVAPLHVNIDLAGTAMVYVTSLIGSVLARWI